MLKYYQEYREDVKNNKELNLAPLSEFGAKYNNDAEIDVAELTAEDIGKMMSGYGYYQVLKIRQALVDYSRWLEEKKNIDVSGFLINLKDVFLHKEKYIDFSKTYFKDISEMLSVCNALAKKNQEWRIKDMARPKRADIAYQRNISRLRICLYLLWNNFTLEEIAAITPQDVSLGINTVHIAGRDFVYDDVVKRDFAAAVEAAEEQMMKALKTGRSVMHNLMQTKQRDYYMHWKITYIYGRDPKTRRCTTFDERFDIRHIQKAALFSELREYEMHNGKIPSSINIPEGVHAIIRKYRDIEDVTAMLIVGEYNIINR